MALDNYTPAQLEVLQYRELQILAKRLGVKANGTRKVLVKRIAEHYKALAATSRETKRSPSTRTKTSKAIVKRTSPRNLQVNATPGPSRMTDTWSGWAPHLASPSVPRYPSLVAENTGTLWASDATPAARQLQHHHQARRTYDLTYNNLDRRARSIPPYHHEGPDAATRTPSKGKGKAKKVRSPLATPAASQEELEVEDELEVHQADLTGKVKSPKCATHTASRQAHKPDASSSRTQASSASSAALSHPSQETVAATPHTAPSQAHTDVSSQDPWLAYAHSQRASPPAFDDPTARAPERRGLAASMSSIGRGEELPLTQLLASSQSEAGEVRVGGVDTASRSVQTDVDQAPRQTIADETVATFKRRLGELHLEMTEGEEGEVRGVLARVRNAARARRARPRPDHGERTREWLKRGREPSYSCRARSPEPPAKRRRL